MQAWWQQFVARVRRRWEASRRSTWGSFVGSAILHLTLLAALALIVLPGAARTAGSLLLVDTDIGGDPEIASLEIVKLDAPLAAEPLISPLQEIAPVAVRPETLTPINLDLDMQLSNLSLDMPVEALNAEGALQRLGDLAGRSAPARAALAKAYGGTPQSEAAVEAGLAWLVRHQNADGSWSFDHSQDYCDESCSYPGNLPAATVAATSMALLSFVGAGYTHEQGKYQREVELGLSWLLRFGGSQATPGDFRQTSQGNAAMYSQGLTAILLCEVYGLTRDEDVGKQAEAAIKFIIAAQNPERGGWRYQVQDRNPDTSVTGWQVMALQSARMCRMDVPGKSRVLADKFLTSVSLENGAYYGYTRPEMRPTTTAVGLLCRMYHGWKKQRNNMREGVLALSQAGPSRDNMYYNYYATQVLHHWGGDEWDKWNEVMREELVSTQLTEGHSAGSWYPRDPHASKGGRLYMTTLAIMTLEVYYRHLPLYQQRSVELILE